MLTVEALNKLNLLPDAVKALSRRLKSELSQTITNALIYAEQKYSPPWMSRVTGGRRRA